jgi:hypothetical protein
LPNSEYDLVHGYRHELPGAYFIMKYMVALGEIAVLRLHLLGDVSESHCSIEHQSVKLGENKLGRWMGNALVAIFKSTHVCYVEVDLILSGKMPKVILELIGCSVKLGCVAKNLVRVALIIARKCGLG